jgi:DNA polymerase I
MEKKKLIIIDSNSIIHRAYHALPLLSTKSGEVVNAVYGFLLVFLKAVKDFQPDFISATFDFPALTFRHKKYKEYKAKRLKAPEELYEQIPKVKEVLEAFNLAIFEKKGFEADDLIGTISNLVCEKKTLENIQIVILSGDSDILQLVVDPRIKVYALRRGVKDVILYDEKLVKEKYQGLGPGQLVDYRALRGDPSDNIPGVAGIGEKTAISLLLEFETLENLYNKIKGNSQKIKDFRPKLKEILLKYEKQAFLSKELALIKKTVPLDFDLEKCCWANYDKEKITKLFKKFEFYAILNKLSEIIK